LHVSAGLESDSRDDLIFRQSARTRVGITTRVGVPDRLKAEPKLVMDEAVPASRLALLNPLHPPFRKLILPP
jgi:hypothetical protein